MQAVNQVNNFNPAHQAEFADPSVSRSIQQAGGAADGVQQQGEQQNALLLGINTTQVRNSAFDQAYNDGFFDNSLMIPPAGAQSSPLQDINSITVYGLQQLFANFWQGAYWHGNHVEALQQILGTQGAANATPNQVRQIRQDVQQSQQMTAEACRNVGQFDRLLQESVSANGVVAPQWSATRNNMLNRCWEMRTQDLVVAKDARRIVLANLKKVEAEQNLQPLPQLMDASSLKDQLIKGMQALGINEDIEIILSTFVQDKLQGRDGGIVTELENIMAPDSRSDGVREVLAATLTEVAAGNGLHEDARVQFRGMVRNGLVSALPDGCDADRIRNIVSVLDNLLTGQSDQKRIGRVVNVIDHVFSEGGSFLRERVLEDFNSHNNTDGPNTSLLESAVRFGVEKDIGSLWPLLQTCDTSLRELQRRSTEGEDIGLVDSSIEHSLFVKYSHIDWGVGQVLSKDVRTVNPFRNKLTTALIKTIKANPTDPGINTLVNDAFNTRGGSDAHMQTLLGVIKTQAEDFELINPRILRNLSGKYEDYASVPDTGDRTLFEELIRGHLLPTFKATDEYRDTLPQSNFNIMRVEDLLNPPQPTVRFSELQKGQKAIAEAILSGCTQIDAPNYFPPPRWATLSEWNLLDCDLDYLLHLDQLRDNSLDDMMRAMRNANSDDQMNTYKVKVYYTPVEHSERNTDASDKKLKVRQMVHRKVINAYSETGSNKNKEHLRGEIIRGLRQNYRNDRDLSNLPRLLMRELDSELLREIKFQRNNRTFQRYLTGLNTNFNGVTTSDFNKNLAGKHRLTVVYRTPPGGGTVEVCFFRTEHRADNNAYHYTPVTDVPYRSAD